MDDFSKFKETEHMLKWFSNEPYGAIRSNIENILKQQVAGSRLKEFKVVSDPQWLTVARPLPAESGQAILTRSGVAFEFALAVEARAQRKHQVWLDIAGTLAKLGAEGGVKKQNSF